MLNAVWWWASNSESPQLRGGGQVSKQKPKRVDPTQQNPTTCVRGTTRRTGRKPDVRRARMSGGRHRVRKHLWPRHDMQDGPQAREGTVPLCTGNTGSEESCAYGIRAPRAWMTTPPPPRAARPCLSCCRRMTQLTTPPALTHSVNQIQQHIEWGMGEDPHTHTEQRDCPMDGSLHENQ